MSDDIDLDLEPFVRRQVPPADPSALTWPATLPIEVAMGMASNDDLCEAYNLTPDELANLKVMPAFVMEVRAAADALKEEGMSFQMKNRLQAEAMLSRLWQMTHASYDEVPPAVQADLIKFSIRAAGYDRSKDQANAAAGGPSLAIQINLG